MYIYIYIYIHIHMYTQYIYIYFYSKLLCHSHWGTCFPSQMFSNRQPRAGNEPFDIWENLQAPGCRSIEQVSLQWTVRPWQTRVGRWVSTKKNKKSGSVLTYQVNLPEGLPENVGKTPKSIGFAQHFPYETGWFHCHQPHGSGKSSWPSHAGLVRWGNHPTKCPSWLQLALR